jgi:hypothetical protein
MSTGKFLKMNKFLFEECWKRIRERTAIENYSQLAVIIETSKSNVTKRKEENNFPIEWAFKVAQKYSLTTEWILTGKECKNVENQGKSNFEDLDRIEEWLIEEKKREKDVEVWFRIQFEKAFPDYKKWKERREESESSENGFLSSKVA